MDIILNELSISKIIREDVFLDFLEVLDIIVKKKYELFKKSDCYDEQTGIASNNESLTLATVMKKSRSDIMRGIKTRLYVLMGDPFWDTQRRHSDVHFYKCDLTNKTDNYGIAEASERDKVVFSFLYKENISIEKEDSCSGEKKLLEVISITDGNSFLLFLYENKKIDAELFLEIYKFKNYKFNDLNILKPMDSETKILFIKNCLDNDRKNNYEEFNLFTTPKKKKYKDEGFYEGYKDKNFHKYRVNGSVRCWGYIESNFFSPVYYETDHKISDS